MIYNPYGALNLPEDEIPEPAGAQVRLDIQREGTLIWLLQQMMIEAHGYNRNIVGADLKDPLALSNIISWQARKQVLEQWLDRFVTLVEGTEDGN